MNTQAVEYNELIAIRVPPSDRWSLVDDPNKVIYNSLTETLEAYFQKTEFKGRYLLDPLDSKLYAIKVEMQDVPEEKPQEYGIYGELNFKQGI